MSAAPISNAATAVPDSSRLATRDNLVEAGQKFEALFIGMMLKSMRQAKLGDSLFESQALDRFREMQDVKTAETMAVHAPLGIGKAMTEFLSRGAPELKAPDAEATE
jgi:flagellar protein FlgJ